MAIYSNTRAMIDPSLIAMVEQAKQNRLNNYNAIKDNLTKGTREMISGLSDNIGKGITKYNRMSEVEDNWNVSPEESNDPVFKAAKRHFIETGDSSQLNAYRMAKASERARQEEKVIRAKEAEAREIEKMGLENKALAENTAVNIGKLYDQSISNGILNMADISTADKQRVKNDYKKLKSRGYDSEYLKYLSDRYNEVTGEDIEAQDVVKTPTETVVVDENIEAKVEQPKSTKQTEQEHKISIGDFTQRFDVHKRKAENLKTRKETDEWNAELDKLVKEAEELGISAELKIPSKIPHKVFFGKKDAERIKELDEMRKDWGYLKASDEKEYNELMSKKAKQAKYDGR